MNSSRLCRDHLAKDSQDDSQPMCKVSNVYNAMSSSKGVSNDLAVSGGAGSKIERSSTKTSASTQLFPRAGQAPTICLS